MSMILERVEENKKRLPAEILADLETKNLSKVMRRQTWPDHERAEYSAFEMALVQATISREGYAELMAQTWFIYVALEEKAEELKGDPIAGPMLFPELPRRALIEEDLVFYFGEDWRNIIKPMPVTEEYVARIRNASPEQYVAHHYTRYLADLSGGLMIAASLRNAWVDLNGQGFRVYDFDMIPDPMAFKKGYREALDSLPVNAEQKRAIIHEVLVAYEYNIELANLLGERFLSSN